MPWIAWVWMLEQRHLEMLGERLEEDHEAAEAGGVAHIVEGSEEFPEPFKGLRKPGSGGVGTGMNHRPSEAKLYRPQPLMVVITTGGGDYQ